MDKSLAVIKQRAKEFYGDAKCRRINLDAILSEELISVVVTTTDIDQKGVRLASPLCLLATCGEEAHD